jgi:hypothetical protein
VRTTLTLIALMLMMSVNAFTQVTPAPKLMNFQGRLTKPDGTPVANGNYSVRFSLWTAAMGGAEKWNQTLNPVVVRNGTFAVLLNAASPADLFDGDRWLEIKVGNNPALTPRQQLVSVAFAMKANTVPDGSIGTNKLADFAVTSAKISDNTVGHNDLASDPVSLAKVAGGALSLDSNRLFVNNGVIQKGGSAIIGTQDLGLYSQLNGHHMRFVTNNAPFNWYADSGMGTNLLMRLTEKANLQINSTTGTTIYANATGGSAIIGQSSVDFQGGVVGAGTGVQSRGVIGQHSSGNNGILGSGSVGVYGEAVNGTSFGGYFKHTAGGIALLVQGLAQIGVVEITGGADLAEKFDVRGRVKPGMVVEIDALNPGTLRLAKTAYSKRVAGILSGGRNLNAGMVLSGAKGSHAVALTGRVWVFADARQRAIEPGDLLTTSTLPGHAMSASDAKRSHGAILGKAMTRLPKGAKGQVLVLVNLQ